MNSISSSDVYPRSLKLIFLALVLFQLFPLFTLDYIVTHDGPSHSNNAGIIRQLITGGTIASDFLHLKFFPEPNWIGHFILVLSGFIFSPEIADKFFLALYILLLPLFFSKLIRTINPNSGTIGFLSVPFVFSIFFFLGVYNFIAGVTILMIALASVLPRISSGGRKLYVRLFIFSVLLYFSHLLTLGVFFLVVGISFLFSLRQDSGMSRGDVWRKIRGMTISLLPVLSLTVYFFFQKLTMTNRPSHVSLKEMLDFIWQVRFAITMTYTPENIYSVALFVFYLVMIVAWIFFNRKTDYSQRTFFQRPAFWLISMGAMFLCYFFIPDEAATGGVVKFRFLLLVYLFLFAFLATADYPKFVSYIIVLFIATWTVLKLNYLYPMMKILSQDAAELITVTERIEPNSILLPYNYSGNWMHDNLSSYAGTRKNILVLDNYEANTPHFPVEWKPGHYPNDIIGIFTSRPPFCTDMSKFKKQTGKEIDYVMFWRRPDGDQDSCRSIMDKYLNENYTTIIGSGNIQLYKFNKLIAPDE